MNRNSAQIKWAKQTAKRLFNRFSFQGNQLGPYQLSSMIGQTYQHLNLGYKSNSNDSKSMAQVLDANKDGKVTYQDFEEMCIKYLCDGVSLGSQSFGNRQSPRANTQKYNQVITSGFQGINNQQNPNNNGLGTKQTFDKYSNKNQSYSQNQIKRQISYTSNQSKKLENNYSNYSNNINQNSKAITTKTYANNNNQPSNVNVNQSVNESISNTENRQLNSQVKEYLAMTQQIFFKYALKQSQTITQREVADVLSQTYAALGIEGYRPTSQDVKVWMKLCDSNEDGHVQYQQYQYFVIRSLQRSGVNLYQQ